MSFTIADAVRGSAPVTAAFVGPSGSGKTYSALLFARGLVGPSGRIGVIDTEGKRSLVYADDPKIGGFRHLDMSAPYSPEACIQALDAAIADGWRAIIFDSASLEHDGEGGLLDMAEHEAEAIAAKNPNNKAVSQQKWTRPKLAHKRFLNHAVGLPAHVIFTFRQTLTTDFSAKPQPVSVLTTVAEKNTMFSLELHAEFSAEHRATWTRVPEPYRKFIKQGDLVSAAMGASISGSIPAVAPVDPQLIVSVGKELDLMFIDDDALAAIFARMKKPFTGDWRKTFTEVQLKWILTEKGRSKLLTELKAVQAEREPAHEEAEV